MSGGGRQEAPPLPDPVPIPVEVDVRAKERDIQRRLSRAKGRAVSTVAGYLTTPPIVSNLALSELL